MGVDIGGTKMAVAAVTRAGRITARLTLPTEASLGFGRAVDRLNRAITEVVLQAGWQPDDWLGVGIGCAGPVDPQRGAICNPFTLSGWDNCDIVSPVRAHFQKPVFLENDADAALLGECLAGAGQGMDPVVMLTFGTGIGSAALTEGRIYRGVEGGHPEFGHLPVETDGPECYCGRAGCFEAIASGTALGLAGQALGLADSRAVLAAAASGDPQAATLVARAVRATATATWSILHTFMPRRIILGGGMMDDHYETFAAAVRAQIQRAILLPRDRVEVVRAVLGNDAGLVGAASLVFAATARPAPSVKTA